MKKQFLIFLTLFSVFAYSQNPPKFPDGIRITGNQPTITSVNFLTATNASSGLQEKIDPVLLPLSTATINAINVQDGTVLHKTGDTYSYSTAFDPVLSQDSTNTAIKKRIISPESYRFNPSLAPIYGWGDSITDGFGTTNYPTQLTTLFGYTVTNKGVGGETSTQIKDRFLAEPANFSKSVIIWAGRNNFTNPTTVKTDIATIISNLGHTRYLVVGIVNANTEPKNSTAWNQINALNADLKDLYGKKFVPIREYLISKYNPLLPQDVIDYGNDVTPTSIRLDALHLNTLGNKYVSEIFNQYLGNLFDTEGYMQSKDFKYYFESLEPVHRTGVVFETIEGEKRFSNTQTVESGSTGRGLYISPTITANANNVKLVGLDVSNVLNAGAFTGVELYQARYEIGIGTSTSIQNKNNSTGAGADARYRLSNSAYNVDFGIRSTGSSVPNAGFIAVGNSSAPFSYFVGGNEMFKMYPSGNVVIQTGGTHTDTSYKLDVNGTARIQGLATLTVSPVVLSETANTIASFDSSKNLKSLSLATYPSLTELAYVKDARSSIQAQIDSIAASATLSGTYTPVCSNSSNFGGGLVNRDAVWTRTGNIVNVKFDFVAGVTSAGVSSNIDITLPFNVATGDQQYIGSGSASVSPYANCYIQANSGASVCTLFSTPSVTTSARYVANITYICAP
jgi:lysophospholipase L1-like esterase